MSRDAGVRSGRAVAGDRRVAAAVVLSGVSCALHIGKLPVAIPVLKDSMGLSLVEAGFLLSVVQMAGLALGLLVGTVADRLGARRVMLAGLVLLALGSLGGALAQSAALLLLSRVMEGLGFLWAVLPAPALLRQRVRDPATQSRALGWWGAYMPMGTALALLVGGALVDVIGWRALWLLLAGLSLLAALGLKVSLPADALGMPTASGPNSTGLRARLVRTLGAPGPWAVALAFFLYSGQWMAVIGFLPTIYQQAGHAGWVLGGLTALAAGVNMTGNIGAGRGLARQTPPHRLLLAGFVAMGLGGWLAFAAGSTMWWQYVGVLLFSAFGGLVPGTLFGIAVRLAPDESTVSTTVGWMQQWSALGQFIGPPLVAALAVHLGGWSGSWWFTLACSVAGGGVAFWIARLWSALPASSGSPRDGRASMNQLKPGSGPP